MSLLCTDFVTDKEKLLFIQAVLKELQTADGTNIADAFIANILIKKLIEQAK